jgi:hypothetical protein
VPAVMRETREGDACGVASKGRRHLRLLSKGRNPILRPAPTRTPDAGGHGEEAAACQEGSTRDEGRRTGREEASGVEMQRTGGGWKGRMRARSWRRSGREKGDTKRG